MATEIKSDQIKSEKLVAIPSANKPTSPTEGMVFRADGTGDSAKGLYEYKNSKWVSLDNTFADMDSIALITSGDTPAVSFAAALNSTSTLAGNVNAVPYEISTGTAVGTLSVPTTGGDSLFTDRNANLVFRYLSSGNSRNNYFGMTIDIPAAFRGQNITVQFQYRTEEASVASSNGDFMFSVWDKSNGISTTQDSTLVTGTTISAGSDILMTAKAGLAVGDKIWFESGTAATGNSANNITQTYITEISGTTNNIKVSGDVIVVSGGRALTGFLSDASDEIKAADSDTNKVGTTFKKAVKLAEDTDQINLYWQVKSATTNQLELFFDGILVSANKFLQASSQIKNECYIAKQQTSFWDGTGTGYLWDKAFLSPQVNTPLLASSKFISISNITSGTNTVTAITAKQNISLSVTIDAYLGNNGQISIFNSSDERIMEARTPSSGAVGFLPANTAINLAKDDYIYFQTVGSTFTDGALTILAESQVSDVIILESQDEIFTPWVSYTPDFTGWGSVSVQNFKWRRVGDTMEVIGSFTIASSTAVPAIVTIPSGYSIDLSKATTNDSNGNSVCGFYIRGEVTSTYHGGSLQTVTGTDNGIFFDFGAFSGGSGNTLAVGGANANSIGGSTEVLSLNFKIPISGWNANFNPLLSMPLVDFGTFENVYTAYIPSTATSVADITQSSNFIATLSKGGTGLWNYTLVSGLFSVAPTLVCSMAQAGSGGNASVGAMSTSTFLIETNNSSNTKTDYSHAFTVTRQGADYRDPPQATAAVIKPAVAILKSVYPYNVKEGGLSAATWTNRTLNTIEGESWFVTLSGAGSTGVSGTNVEFTLEKGQYKIFAITSHYETSYTSSRLYDVTNGATVAWSDNGYIHPGGHNQRFTLTTLTIGSSTQYKMQTISAGTSSTIGFGYQQYNDSNAVSIYSQVQIEKLK